MRIGLLSDTHNHLRNVESAVARFRAEGIRTLLHAGDITGPPILRALAGFDVWVVRGNMDRDSSLGTVARRLFGPGRMAEVHYLTLDGQRIALLHGDDRSLLEQLSHSGGYAYVIHGHTHTPRDERFGHTRVINPGALGGSGWRPRSCAILDLKTGGLEYLRIQT